MKYLYSLTIALLSSSACAFTTTGSLTRSRQVVSTSSSTLLHSSTPKGFGSSKTRREKSDGQIKREKESSKYDEIASQGGQEYNVWVRQFGSGGEAGDKGWMPCGAIAVPRAAQVSDAIFANEQGLKAAISRVYPQLKGDEFLEFGYNLKIYPDDPVETAKKNGPRPSGISVGNWINTLLSPIDASKVPPPPAPSSE
ncbi:hypothetical protein MPSEU_000196200 [Mayamaea pseudoterrestris]|nr:hypothetical protein MPSEU_000196200 [Mayamaea pseudoterrestris]